MFEFIITAGEKLASLAMFVTIVYWARGPKPGSRGVPFIAPFFVLIIVVALFITSTSEGDLAIDGKIGVALGFTVAYLIMAFFTLGFMCATKAAIVLYRVLTVKIYLQREGIDNKPFPAIVDVCYHNRTKYAKNEVTWL